MWAFLSNGRDHYGWTVPGFLRYPRLVIMLGLGGFALVAGERDGFPGLQGIRLIVMIVAVVPHGRWTRQLRKNRLLASL